MRKIALLAFIVFAASMAQAQQLHFMSQLMQHNTMYNPAAAGMSANNRVGVAYRSMWASFPGNPKTTLIYGDFDLKKFNSGIATYLYRDETGPTSRTGVQLAYAYHIKSKSEKSKFSIGLELRGFQYALDKTKLSTTLASDPAISGAQNKFAVDAGLGVYWTNNKLTAGVAVSQLIQSKLELAEVANANISGKLYRHYNFNANYKIQTGEDVYLIPFFMARVIENSPSEFDLGVKLDYQDKLWWALNWRANQLWSLQAGAKILQRLRLSYSYDIYNSPISAFEAGSGSHEVALQFDLKKK
jgi:type IX secretion system PorP/SprF family membrane protein